ncbi:MAG: Fe-S cluster assembly protein IscX [Phycisphaerae bacterium]|nr:Fe-S cluster assembly protein IscX [Phycisphaerae bacterium]
MMPPSDTSDDRPAGRAFTVRFEPMGVTVTVEPDRIPFGRTGLPGSLLDIALAHGVEIDHACGGVCACCTCHVIVKEGFGSLRPATEQEEDMLDNAPGLTTRSRLACQAIPDGSCDLVVDVPAWNRNLAKESDGHAGATGMGTGSSLRLGWTDSEAIGRLLLVARPEVHPLSVGFTNLHAWVCSLPGFDDPPDASNEGRLEAIQMAWLRAYEALHE